LNKYNNNKFGGDVNISVRIPGFHKKKKKKYYKSIKIKKKKNNIYKNKLIYISIKTISDINQLLWAKKILFILYPNI
jgi:hypothetical protein